MLYTTKNCFGTQIGKKDYLVYRLNSKHDLSANSREVNILHHIHIIDRSLSLSSDIDNLIEDVKRSIDLIPIGDFVTIIWFSGEGECGTVIKCVKKVDSQFSYIKTLLDSIKSCLSTTYFYQSIQELVKIIQETQEICPYYNVTLFTDGNSVCNNPEKDMDDCINTVGVLSNDIIAFNTIGYGNYYDENFLKSLSDKSEFGIYSHANEITDYSEIFSHNYTRIHGVIAEKLDVRVDINDSKGNKVESYPDDFRILYLSSKNTMMVNKNEFHISSTDKNKNQVFVILPKDVFYTDEYFIQIKLNDNIEVAEKMTQPSLKRKKELNSTITNLFMAIAYNLYYNNRREESLDVLTTNLMDKQLIDSHMQAFTKNEVNNHIKLLRKLVFKKKLRNFYSVPADYLPDPDCYSLMTFFNDLSLVNAIYIPDTKHYKRIGLKTLDTVDLFELDKTHPAYGSFNEMIFNESKINVSIRFTEYGHVNILAKTAKRVNLPSKIASKRYKNHTIIKDGNLNMTKIKIGIPKDLLSTKFDSDYTIKEKLVELFECKKSTKKVINNVEYAVYNVDLTKLPVINRNFIKNSDNMKYIYDAVMTVHYQKVKQKVLNYLIDLRSKKDPSLKNVNASSTFVSYNQEQMNVLTEHGLNKKLEYVGTERKTESKKETDFYMANVFEFKLKGCSSIPAIEDALKRYDNNRAVGKEIPYYVRTIHRLVNKYRNMNDKSLFKELEDTKKILTEYRIILNEIKIAKVLTGSWFNELEMDANGKWIYKSDEDSRLGLDLIIIAKKEKVYF